MADAPGTFYNPAQSYGPDGSTTISLPVTPQFVETYPNAPANYGSEYDASQILPVTLEGFAGGVPCGTDEPPVIQMLSPAPGTVLTAQQPLMFDVVYPSESNNLGFINITINEEAVLNAIGGFTTKYAGLSSQTNPNPYTRRFVIVRAPEWMLNPTIFIQAITSHGIPLE